MVMFGLIQLLTMSFIIDGYVRSNSVVDHELHNKTPSVQTPPKNVSAEKTKHVASGMTLILSGFASVL